MSNEILTGALGKFADPLPLNPLTTTWVDIVAPPERSHVVSLGVEQAEAPRLDYIAQDGDGHMEVAKAIKRVIAGAARRNTDSTYHPRGSIIDVAIEFESFNFVVDVTDTADIPNHSDDHSVWLPNHDADVFFRFDRTRIEERGDRVIFTYHVQQEG